MSLKKNLVWSKEKFVLADLKNHQPHYPLLVKVRMKGKSFSQGNEKLMLLHGMESQERLLARNRENQVISIPVDHPQKLILQDKKAGRSARELGKRRALKAYVVMKNYSPPIVARFCDSTNTKFYIGTEVYTSRTFGTMTIEKSHMLDYLVTSSIEDSGEINTNEIGTLPTYLEIDVTQALSIKDLSDEDFSRLVQSYASATKYMTESKIETASFFGLGSIMGYEESSDTWSYSNEDDESSPWAVVPCASSLPETIINKIEKLNPYMTLIQARRGHPYKSLTLNTFLSPGNNSESSGTGKSVWPIQQRPVYQKRNDQKQYHVPVGWQHQQPTPKPITNQFDTSQAVGIDELAKPVFHTQKTIPLLATRPLSPTPHQPGGRRLPDVCSEPTFAKAKPASHNHDKVGFIDELSGILQKRKELSEPEGHACERDTESYKGTRRLSMAKSTMARPSIPKSPFLQKVGTLQIQNQNDSHAKTFRSLGDVPLDISEFGVQEVSRCLFLLNLKGFIDRFTKEQIDGILLKSLSVEDLKEMGLSGAQATKLYQFAVNGWRPAY